MNKHDREKMVRRMYRRFKGTHLANPLVSWFVQSEVDRAVRSERKAWKDAAVPCRRRSGGVDW